MKTFKFEYAVKPYEAVREGIVYKREQKNECEYTISNDAERSFIFLKPKNEEEAWCKNVYKYIAKKTLLESTVDYYQGMLEVSSYFVLFYFENSIKSAYSKIISELNNVDMLSEDSENNLMPVENEFSQYIDEKIYEKCSIVITNVLKEKYIPLVENDFKLYKKYNKTFMKMMKSRNVNIRLEISGSYMNNTLSWFSRSMENLEDVYKIFAIIISCPTNMVFLILVNYFKNVEKGEKVTEIEDNLYEKLIELEHEFVRTESSKESELKALSNRNLLIGTAALGILLAIVFYKVYKKEE